MRSKRERQKRRARMFEAMRLYPHVAEAMVFENITVTLLDGGRHWQFRCNSQFLLDYWPAAAKCCKCGQSQSIACRSPIRAGQIAADMREAMLLAIRRAFQETAVAVPTPAEQL